MGKPNERKREKHDKRRALAKQRAKERELPDTYAGLVRLASTQPFGPAWVCASYDDDVDPGAPPTLVSVIVTRRLPGGRWLAASALVDRTCLGIKDAYVMEPAVEAEVARRVAQIGERLQDPMRRCETLLAQSIVFHALDFATGLGFTPHREFEAALFGPRPTQLLSTRLARPEHPFYCSGPDDDARAILRRLDARVGRGNYEFVGGLDDDDDDHGPWLDDEGEQDDDDAWDDLARAAAIELVRARRALAPSPPVDGAIDWPRACFGVPCEHVFEGMPIDLSAGAAAPEACTLDEAVDHFVHLLECRRFLAWEAVLREEQGLVLSPAQKRELGQLCSFANDDEDDVTLWIEEGPRPTEPWYETLRALAPYLVIERFVTNAVHYDGETTWGAQLLEAVAKHGGELSRPPECTNVTDILPAELWHRLLLQPIFDTLSGLGYCDRDRDVVSLSDPDGPERIAGFLARLDRHAESLAILGWGATELLDIVELPARDRRLLLETIARHDRTDGLASTSADAFG